MMKKLLVGIILISAYSARSQVYVAGRNINADTSVQYMEVQWNDYPNMRIYWVDVGQKKAEKFTDADGKKMGFNSFVDMLTYLKRNGWVLLRRDMIFHASSVVGEPRAFILFERVK